MNPTLSSLAFHLKRLRYQLGRKLRLGANEYRVRGYWPDRFSTETGRDPHVLRTIERVLPKRKGAFIDVGVNVGQTLRKVLSIDPSRPYFGFEPQISCVFFVDQFIRDNGLSHVHVFPIALAEAGGFLQLYSNSACDEMASLLGNRHCDGIEREVHTIVPVRKGDDAIEELGLEAISIIKIDVEGAELRVLLSLKQSLAKFRPTVLFEQLPNYRGEDRVMNSAEDCDRNRTTAKGIQEFFAAAGYQIHQIDGEGEDHLIQEFDLDDSAGHVSSDYIAYPTTS